MLSTKDSIQLTKNVQGKIIKIIWTFIYRKVSNQIGSSPRWAIIITLLLRNQVLPSCKQSQNPHNPNPNPNFNPNPNPNPNAYMKVEPEIITIILHQYITIFWR